MSQTDDTGQDDWLDDIDVAADDTEEITDDTEGDGSTEDTSEESESAEAEKQEEQAADKQPTADETEDDKSEESEEAESKDEAEAENQDEADAEAERKRHNNEMAQQRIQQKELLKKTTDAYVGQFKDQVEEAGDDEVKRELAELKLKDAERDARDFLREVETNQAVMQNDHSRASREIDMFRQFNDDGTANQNFSQKAYDLALSHLAPHLQTQVIADEDGNEQVVIIGSNVSVYEFLKTEAENLKEFAEGIRSTATAEGQRNEAKMRGAAEPVAGGATPKPRENPADKEAREMKEIFDDI